MTLNYDYSGRELQGTAFASLLKQVHKLMDMDLTFYKPDQVKRLLESARRRYGADSYAVLLKRLRADPELLAEFKGRMSINVSEFFRDPPRYDYLTQTVLPEIGRNNSLPRVWSAGSSVGCEPYSIAILLKENGWLGTSNVLGSDIDVDAVARARTGLYWESEIRHVPRALRGKYFHRMARVSDHQLPVPPRRTKDGDLEAIYRLRDDVRSAVNYRVEDLFKSRYSDEFDLIVCRNVTIYFTEEAKKFLYTRLCAALKQGGYLFVGGTEIIFQAEKLGLDSNAPFFYRKQ